MLVFRLKGDGEHVTAAPPGMLEEVVSVKDFLAERDNPDPMCRWRKAEEWQEIELQPYPGLGGFRGISQNLHSLDIGSSNSLRSFT